MSEPRVLDDLLLDACVGCGCRDERACADGCAWAIPYLLCTTCRDDLPAAIQAWIERAADAVARLVAWRRDLDAHQVEQLELGLRECLIAIALPDTPLLTAPRPEGDQPRGTASDSISDQEGDELSASNTSAGRAASGAVALPRPAHLTEAST